MTGPELRAIRKALNLTRKAFGVRIGIHEVTVARYELGTQPIPRAIGMAAQLAKLQSLWVEDPEVEPFSFTVPEQHLQVKTIPVDKDNFILEVSDEESERHSIDCCCADCHGADLSARNE
jgi:transcriptional regulator with XRE-family HTH domain